MYDWIKVLHVVAVISWMAGLLYLPRLFVYHADAISGGDLSKTLKIMERRLMRFIMRPAMIVSWLTGLFMLWEGVWLQTGDLWVFLKLGAVIILSIANDYLARHIRLFSEDRNKKSARFFRFINEIPTMLMIIIVAMVILKPVSF